MLPIGVSPLRFDQLTHHFASCMLSLKTVHFDSSCALDVSNWHSSLLRAVPFPSIKALRFGNHGPCGSRKFIGKRRYHNAVGPAFQQGLDPGRFFAAGNDSSCSVHQHSSNISIAPFRDPKLPCSPSGSCLPWGQAKPGRKLSARFKSRHIRGRGNQGGSGQGGLFQEQPAAPASGD